MGDKKKKKVRSKYEMKTKALLVFFFGFLFVTTGPMVWSYGNQLADMETKAIKGEILPFEIDSQKPVEVQIGGIHVLMTFDQLSEGFNLSHYVYLGFDYPFQISLKDRRFLISVDIENAKGVTIAKIVDNHWMVKNDPVIAYDRNYNSYAFEVIDSDLVPVIQIIFYPDNKMYLGGLIYGPNNTTLFMFDDTTIINPSPENITQNRNPIFKYPSSQHLGEMVEKSQYEVPRVSTIVIIIGVILTALGIFLIPYGEYLREKPKRYRKSTKRGERNE